MKKDFLKSIIFILVLSVSNTSFGQDLVDNILDESSLNSESELFTERINIISRSKKIFITTNTNQMLNKGDFITIILNQKLPVFRALVAKTHDGQAGVKVLKIYSLKNWSLMRKNLDVDILKGDDSRLFKKEKKKVAIEESKIETEEDLYKDTTLFDDVGLLNKDNRHIKPDNIVSAGWSRYQFRSDLQADPETLTSNQLHINWAYQFADNFWLEGSYGRTLFNDFPAIKTQTLINNFSVKLKYTIKAPLYSYIMPYVGFQSITASSPDAGFTDDATLAEREIAAIQGLESNNLIIGASLLRRLVPGWFAIANLGTDGFMLGVGIEF